MAITRYLRQATASLCAAELFKPRLNVRNAARAFRRAGWEVHIKRAWDVSLFLRHQDFGLVAVSITPGEPTKLKLGDLTDFGIEQNARIVVLSQSWYGEDTRSEAAGRRIVLVTWPDINELPAQLRAINIEAAKILAAAKLSEKAEVQSATHVSLLELTKQQKAAGFFCATPNVACWFVDRESDILLVTFSKLASGVGAATRWGETFGRLSGYSQLGFESTALNCFPADGMEQCINAANVKLADRYETRLLLGAGQGAFAALYYSRQLASTALLGVSPLFSIDPVVVSDPRYNIYYKSDWHSGVHVSPKKVTGRLFAIYDPYDEGDRIQIGHLAQIESLNLLRLPFAGHGCPSLLARPAVLLQVLRFCHLGSAEAALKTAVQVRRNNALRPRLMAFSLAGRHPATSYKLFTKYGSRSSEPGWGNVCYKLAQAGYAAEVFGWVAAFAAKDVCSAEPQALAALVAMQMSNIGLAFEFIHKARRIEPANKKYLYIESIISTRSRCPDLLAESLPLLDP